MRLLILTSVVTLLACGPEDLDNSSDDPIDAQAQALAAPLAPLDASCLQLHDTGTWATSAANAASIGTAAPMADVLDDLNRRGPVLGANHPAATGYKYGFAWQSGDVETTEWIPQGLTAGVANGRNVLLGAWYFKPPSASVPNRGVRVSVADVTDMSGAVPYRHVLLVEPKRGGDFVPVKNHGGGIAWLGDFLYEADTNTGVRVFDLRGIRKVDTSSVCKDRVGVFQGRPCAYGYAYVLPQSGAYVMPSARADGTPISQACRPKFSFLGKDTRGADALLSGEYCKAKDTDSPCDRSPTTGLGGRLYRWRVGADGKLLATGGFVSAQKAWVLNVANAQGVAPVMTAGQPADAFWVSSTEKGGQLVRVAPGAAPKRFLSSGGDFSRMPEGLHATGSGTNLWTVTEGVADVTDPGRGGRVVFAVNQASVD